MLKKGFTLIEILIAVIVAAVLAAFAVMYYGRFIERARIAEAEAVIASALTSQERAFLKYQKYTAYWHKLDAAPIAVRTPKEQNDFANGLENTIYYTRGGVLSGMPNNGFAISFEQDATDRWFAVARRVGSKVYTYHLVRPFDDTQVVCVPEWDNDKDLALCVDYMGVEHFTELKGDPMVPKIEED